ncbi:hypothetical protein [Amaricoccus sp.]|nr:hypothetical protein [Amaricoccus sp.]HRO10321.1 hypothetical protein [Amaricoccus sp.]
MTVGWFIFGVVMPAIVVAVGLTGAYLHDRSLRKDDTRRNAPAE